METIEKMNVESVPTRAEFTIKKISHKTQYSTTERVMSQVPQPLAYPLDTHTLFPRLNDHGNTINVDALQAHFIQEGRLHVKDALLIIRTATEIFRSEPNIVSIRSPVNICGDIHGQYYDLVKLFEVGGPVYNTTYLFLGDYVDRGAFSVEVLLHLYALKILNKDSFFLIRGNHECRQLTEYFTFKLECERKYSIELYEAAIASFQALPIGALVNKQFFCIHGGLSPELKYISDYNRINRFCEPPSFGAMCDTLWADPADNFIPQSGDFFCYNSGRNCSYTYTYYAVCDFLERNKLLTIVRAHQTLEEGFKMYDPKESTGFPSLISIFSAPNYLDRFGNRGAILHYDKSELNIRQFTESAHPYWLPKFTDAFTWSSPFVAQKIADIVLSLLVLCDDKEEEEIEAKEEKLSQEQVESRREGIKKKIQAVSSFINMYSTLRDEAETTSSDNVKPPDGVPQEKLLLGGKASLSSFVGYKAAKELEEPNEKRPDLA